MPPRVTVWHCGSNNSSSNNNENMLLYAERLPSPLLVPFAASLAQAYECHHTMTPDEMK